jgi:magnesium-dependent phosphatase 1
MLRSSEGQAAAGGPYPGLVVFDLDECVWSPEMFTLSHVPTAKDVISGELGNAGMGVAGVRSGGHVIRMYPGALAAFQRIHAGEYGPNLRVAAASSADTPQAVRIGKAALGLLEVVPGVSLLQLFRTAGGGFGQAAGGEGCNLQIGRSAPLSSDKSATHFPILRDGTGVPYGEMLFFDDCIWTDHCTAVGRNCKGVVTQTTPHGMTVQEWEAGLEHFRQRSAAPSS